MFSLSPLTVGSIIFLPLLQYLVLFRLCFCYWQDSKLKLFLVLRAKTLGIPLDYYFPNGLRLLSEGKEWIDGVAQLLDSMTEAFVSNEL